MSMPLNSLLLARHFVLAAAAALGVLPGSTHAQTVPFTIGVLPNVSARVIIANYQPMRTWLGRELGQPVDVATAPDFRGFHERTLRGEYDLIVTAANLGRVAQLDGRWEPIAIYDPPIPALLVASADRREDSPAQLRGRVLALANPQSLVALRGFQWLQDQGLVAGRDFQTVQTPNEDSLGALIRSGEAPMAIMSMGEFRQIGEPVRQTLRVVTEFARVPGFWVMVNPKLAPAERQRMRTVLLAFPATEDGKAFFKLAGVQNIRDITAQEQAALDPFVATTRAGLSPPR